MAERLFVATCATGELHRRRRTFSSRRHGSFRKERVVRRESLRSKRRWGTADDRRPAAREVLEETGYHARANGIAFLAERRHDRWSAPSLEICFYAEVLPAPRHRPSSEDGEQVVEWLSIDRAGVVMHLPRAIFLLTGERGRYILSEDTERAIERPNHL